MSGAFPAQFALEPATMAFQDLDTFLKKEEGTDIEYEGRIPCPWNPL